MAIAELNKIDEKLTAMYANQVTTATTSTSTFEDKSELLFEQMQMIAFNNKAFLNLK